MIISNTTPINNLIHLNQLPLLTELFGRIYIPLAVADELDVIHHNYSIYQKLIADQQIIIKAATNNFLVQQLLPSLHLGEAQAISLCLELQAKLFLIDDKDGRTVAAVNKIPAAGTLGILLRAKKEGLIRSIKPLIDKLRLEHHFWIKQDMYDKVLNLAKESQES